MLNGKTIIVGISGGIAAYKACDLVSKLKQLGADVWVVMTESSTKFVAPLTFRTLSQNPVITSLFSEEISAQPVPHISLTQKAHLIAVVPATANIIARAAQGLADDALATMLLSAKCPKVFAPAMNSAMWENQFLQENLNRLKKSGAVIINPASGYLACGESGDGKLADIREITNRIVELLSPQLDLKGKKLLISAGGTREAIDPVRFIGNRSSGKMGFALAQAAAERGAEVTLAAVNTSLTPPKGIKLISLGTADELSQIIGKEMAGNDVLIMAAAVADYAPVKAHKDKIKKNSRGLRLDLRKTADVLSEAAKYKKKNQVIVGFAAETENLVANAKEKLLRKKMDLIVANDVSRDGTGFESDYNQVHIISRSGKSIKTERLPKIDIAHQILDSVSSILCMQK